MKTKWIPSKNFVGETKLLIVPIKTKSKLSYLIKKCSILILLLIMGGGVGGLFYLIDQLIKNN